MFETSGLSDSAVFVETAAFRGRTCLEGTGRERSGWRAGSDSGWAGVASGVSATVEGSDEGASISDSACSPWEGRMNEATMSSTSGLLCCVLKLFVSFSVSLLTEDLLGQRVVIER